MVKLYIQLFHQLCCVSCTEQPYILPDLALRTTGQTYKHIQYKLIKWFKNSKKCQKNKIKVSLFKCLLRELNNALNFHCFRVPEKKKKNALYFEMNLNNYFLLIN